MATQECETTIFINDVEIPATVTFSENEDGVKVIGLIATVGDGKNIDMFTPSFDWLLTDDIIEGLEEDAQAHINSVAADWKEHQAALQCEAA